MVVQLCVVVTSCGGAASFPYLCFAESFPQCCLPRGQSGIQWVAQSMRPAHCPFVLRSPDIHWPPTLSPYTVPEAKDTANGKTESHGVIRSSPGAKEETTKGKGGLC